MSGSVIERLWYQKYFCKRNKHKISEYVTRKGKTLWISLYQFSRSNLSKIQVNYSIAIRTTPRNLLLTFGALKLLLKKLSPTKSFEYTRLAIEAIMPNVLKASIMLRKYVGVNCFIPRTPMWPNDLPVVFRLQLLLRLNITINNKQISRTITESCCISLPCLFKWPASCWYFKRGGNPDSLFILYIRG